MKQIILLITITFMAIVATAQMDVPGDGGNIKATTSEVVGITSITIDYSRPGVKGREGKIWGGVVGNGFGNYSFVTGGMTSPWRAGANEATTISFEHDVKVEDKDLKAGTYALFMAIGEEQVTLIFSTQKEAWGSFYYTPEDDVLRVEVKPVALEKSVERLKYEFIEHRENSCVIAMQWEKLSVPFRIEVDVDNIVLARVREQMTSVKGMLSANMIHASRYFFFKNIHLEEALGWAEKAVTGKPFGQTGFDAYQNLAMGYEKLNRLPQADSVMNIALTIEDISRYSAYCRKLIKQQRSDRAIKVMQSARDRFGEVYAVNNNLSYAHSANGDFKKALAYATSALKQAPSESARKRINNNIEKLKTGTDIN